MGEYRFAPEQVRSIRKVGYPLFSIRIRHNVAEYPEGVIFSCLTRPSKLIHRIEDTGFHCGGGALDGDISSPRGLALRVGTVFLFLVVWNALLLAHGIFHPLGYEIHLLWCIDLLMLPLISVGLRVSRKVRDLVIGPGGTYIDVRWFIDRLALLSVIMFIVQILMDLGIMPGPTNHR
jgi:hypothetical protein